MKKILSKILEEINKETPRLDYIRGLIEASIEDETVDFAEKLIKGGASEVHLPPRFELLPINIDKTNVDEEIIPDFVKAGPIGKITS